MTKFGKLFLVIALISVVAIAFFLFQKKPAPVTEPPVQNVEPTILGNKDDLVSFSVAAGSKVSGIMEATGTVKNNYFFEANIVVNILDAGQKLLRQGHGEATTDWMTTGPVSFKTTLDFTGLTKGPAYIEIHNDNPSDLREYDKHILIPVVIE